MRRVARGIALVLGLVAVVPAAADHWKQLDRRALEFSNQGRYHDALVYALKARDGARAEEGARSDPYLATTIRAASASVDVGDLAQAKSLAREAEALTPANPILRARLLMVQAEIALAEERHGEAARLNRQALETAERTSAPGHLRAEIANRLGLALKRAGRYEEAERAYRQALALAAGDAGKERVVLNNLGLLYYDAGDLARAEEYLKQAVDLARRRVNAMGEDTAGSYTGLAKVYLELGRPRQAEALLHEALGLVSQNGILDTLSGHLVLLNLCIALNDLSRPAEAETYCRKAASVARNLGPGFQVEPQLHLARALSLQGRPLTARRALDKAQKLARRTGNPEDLAHTHYTLGLHLIAQRRFDAARDHLRQALDVLPGSARAIQRAAILGALGQATLLAGDARAAIPLLEQARTIEARLTPGAANYAATLFILAKAHHRLGQADKARALYRQALPIATQAGDSATAAGIRRHLRRLDAGQPPDLGALAEVGR